MMQSVPLANRRHVVIFGDTNAGKSSLFNAIIGQDAVIVSDMEGTTTDPVIKAMELIPYGPIALVDTAGLGDTGELGGARMKKTEEMLLRTDLALYAADCSRFDAEKYRAFLKTLRRFDTPCVVVLTKTDACGGDEVDRALKSAENAVAVSVRDPGSISKLKARIAEELTNMGDDEQSMIADLVPTGGTAVLVCPIDSAAPKGRLILPQVQLIRDCLDHGVACGVVKETELAAVLENLKSVDLVVTDSQAFKVVSSIVPREIPLTSFSLLMGRQKGDLKVYLKGADAVGGLKDGARVLVAEGCSHNITHEDIGHNKLPKGLARLTGKRLDFDFVNGHDFPDSEGIKKYDLVIHCGGCMLNRKSVQSRIKICRAAGVPITNYGVTLALITGVLDRCREVFEKE